MTTIIGTIGSILLALCGLPELIRSYQRKKADIGWGFLNMWLFGEILLLAYVFMTYVDIILLLNYGANIVIILGLVYYKILGERG